MQSKTEAYSGAEGSYRVTSYNVFPGIELIYNDISLCEHDFRPEEGKALLEIHHCRSGRMECRIGADFFYLAPGDLSISLSDGAISHSSFPTGSYEGVTIRINGKDAPRCLSCFLADVNVQPDALREKFCPQGQCFVARSSQAIEHIFSELYSVPESIRKGYFKVKILELLLFLSAMELDSSALAERRISNTQVELAKRIGAYLSANMDRRITLEELSNSFHMSQSALKSCFRAVYGESVYSYIRAQKMQCAAADLRRSEMSIMEIAGRYGYDNGSKFAKAFRDTVGMSPTEYRNARVSCKIDKRRLKIMKFHIEDTVKMFGCGVLFGTAGIKILRSRDAKTLYTHVTAAVLRAKDCVMQTADDIRCDCEDIYAGAKSINARRAEEEAAAVIEATEAE